MGNLYAYVGNNPTNWIDLSGMWCPKDPEDCDPTSEIKDVTVDVYHAGGDVINSAGEAIDCFATDIDCIRDPYIDVNIATVCIALCITGGFQSAPGQGIHPYFGTGIGLQFSLLNVSWGPFQSITHGFNCGVQASYGIVTAQGGVSGFRFDKEGRYHQNLFGEVGLGPGVGRSYTCYFIF